MKLKWMMLLAATGLSFSTSALAHRYTVKMLNHDKNGIFVFQPDYLRVQPGDTVTFVATATGHNSQSVLVPAGAKGWKGRLGHNIQVTLTKQGVYIYECRVHGMLGMLGVIQVGQPVNDAAAKKAAKRISARLEMNKGRLEKLMAKVKR